jgi:hypothetical protein
MSSRGTRHIIFQRLVNRLFTAIFILLEIADKIHILLVLDRTSAVSAKFEQTIFAKSQT